jgi:hypothetical protein
VVVSTGGKRGPTISVRGYMGCRATRRGGNLRATTDVEPETDAEREVDVNTAVVPSSAALSAADRCDRCGAQAYLRVELQSGLELHFCAHHAREHGDKLREVATVFHDETERLAGTPATATESEH